MAPIARPGILIGMLLAAWMLLATAGAQTEGVGAAVSSVTSATIDKEPTIGLSNRKILQGDHHQSGVLVIPASRTNSSRKLLQTQFQGWYRIQTWSGLPDRMFPRNCVDVPGGSSQQDVLIQQWYSNMNGGAQRFYLQPVEWPFVYIITEANLCLDVRYGSTGDRAPIIQYGCNGGDNQKWIIREYSGPFAGRYQVSPKHAQAQCLDIDGNSIGNGARLQIYGCHLGQSQQFTFALW